jgi:hypothetical protein
MKNIKLYDIDSKIPNLALMKLSAYHKSVGDNVGFKIEKPDRIYASVIFKKNKWKADALRREYPKSEVFIGGAGYNFKTTLPQGIELLKPDYDLYPSEYSLGYTTRGCIRNCDFCIVPKKEGKLRRAQHIREFHDDRFKTVICLDNNIYADKKWFFENTNYILENKLKFNAIQGMDIRILDKEIAERLKELKWDGMIHFAFDNMKDEKKVLSGIDLLKSVGIKTRSKVSFYVLVGHSTTIEEDIYRCRLLKKHGATAYVMQYKKSPETARLAWWANRPINFWTKDVTDIKRKFIHDVKEGQTQLQ